MPRVNQNMRLAEATRQYLGRMERSGAAKASVDSAAYTLGRLTETVRSSREPDPYVHLLSPADMDDFCYGENGLLQGRRGRRIGASYFNRCRSVLRSFFDYCLLMGWVNDNPARHIVKAKPDAKPKPLMLNATELEALLQHANNPVERIGCALGMNTGLRGNDIKRLTVFDANLVSGEIQTEIRKTRDLDVKPITAELHEELERWMRIYAKTMGVTSLPNDWLLVPSYFHSGLKNTRPIFYPHRVHMHPWRLVQRPLERMGYPSVGAGFHTLRRSSARALFEMLREEGSGRDHALLLVKTYLNHASTSQTEVYLGLEPERVLRDELLKGKSFLRRLAAEQAGGDTVILQLAEAKDG